MMNERITKQELLLVKQYRNLDKEAKSYVTNFIRGLLESDEKKKNRLAVGRIDG